MEQITCVISLASRALSGRALAGVVWVQAIWKSLYTAAQSATLNVQITTSSG